MKTKQKVIVIGAGFAGLNFVKQLSEDDFEILLIDKVNHHQFQPLFYQVATSQIEPASISFPLRHILRKKKNLQIRLAEVYSINENPNEIHTSIGVFSYDLLVLAIGCKTNFFGNNNIAKHALTLKSTYDAIEIRNHVLENFEKILSSSLEEKKNRLNLAIVGAGPTGVELAGAFAEIKKHILPKDYPGIDFSEFKIYLIEGSAHTLNSMSENAKINSKKYLQDMGVELITETFVKNYDGISLELSNGQTLNCKTLIWAAGVIGNTLEGLPKESITNGNRIIVDRYNKVNHCKHIYAIGDIALMHTPLYPKGHPQLANVAINQAINLAKNLNRLLKNKEQVAYEYKDLGSMATIGRNKAVVDLPKIKFKGFFAWLVWMFLHLMLILSVKNKLIIFINWTWAYFSKNSALRLILKSKTPKALQA